VTSVLLYTHKGSVVSDPVRKEEVDHIEAVQRRATKLIPELKGLPCDYEDHLKWSLYCRAMKHHLKKENVLIPQDDK
jgi:hypothetical protein